VRSKTNSVWASLEGRCRRPPWMQVLRGSVTLYSTANSEESTARRIAYQRDIQTPARCKMRPDEWTDGQPSPAAAIGPQGERVWPISVVESTRRREEKIIDCRTVTYLVAGAASSLNQHVRRQQSVVYTDVLLCWWVAVTSTPPR